MRNLDAMIVEREEYVELVDAWLGAGGDPSPISEEVPQRWFIPSRVTAVLLFH